MKGLYEEFPSHAWMAGFTWTQEETNNEGIHEGDHNHQENIENMEHREDVIDKEVYPPSLLGRSKPYRTLRHRPLPKPPLPKWSSSTKPATKIRKKLVSKKRAKWFDKDLASAIDCYDIGYIFGECNKAFNIPKFSLRYHLSEKIKSRKTWSFNNTNQTRGEQDHRIHG